MTPPMVYTGAKLTKDFESCELVPYQDVKGVWTDGWGNTHGVVPNGPPISQATADADLARNMQNAVSTVNHQVASHITQGEFDALVDLVFNIGAGNFAGSTMLRKLNVGDLAGAAAEFEKWDMSGGVHVAGLLRRRLAERAEFEGRA